MKKTFKIIIANTEKSSHIYRNNNNNALGYITGKHPEDLEQFPNQTGTSNQHLYVISEEGVKDVDLCILDWEGKLNPDDLRIGEKVGNAIRNQYGNISIPPTDGRYPNHKWYKIVATTDKDLGCFRKAMSSHIGVDEDVFQNLPKLQEAFIQAYIKAYNEGKPITEVDLEMKMDFVGYFEGTRMENWDKVIKTRPDNTVIVVENQ